MYSASIYSVIIFNDFMQIINKDQTFENKQVRSKSVLLTRRKYIFQLARIPHVYLYIYLSLYI